MVYAIKMGRIKPRLPAWALSDPQDVDAARRYGAYMASGNLGALDSDDEEDTLGLPTTYLSTYTFPDVWADQNRDAIKPSEDIPEWQRKYPQLMKDYIPPRPRPFQRPPQEPLPGHIDSYNPPPEFILTDDEVVGCLMV